MLQNPGRELQIDTWSSWNRLCVCVRFVSFPRSISPGEVSPKGRRGMGNSFNDHPDNGFGYRGSYC